MSRLAKPLVNGPATDALRLPSLMRHALMFVVDKSRSDPPRIVARIARRNGYQPSVFYRLERHLLVSVERSYGQFVSVSPTEKGRAFVAVLMIVSEAAFQEGYNFGSGRSSSMSPNLQGLSRGSK